MTAKWLARVAEPPVDAFPLSRVTKPAPGTGRRAGSPMSIPIVVFRMREPIGVLF